MPALLTPKQEKLSQKVIESRLGNKKAKPFKEMMLESGYTPLTARNPAEVLKSANLQAEIARRTKIAVEQMEKNRALMLDRIPKKMAKAPFNHLVNGVDIMTKNIQLLSGKSTENTSIHIEISEHVASKNEPILEPDTNNAT